MKKIFFAFALTGLFGFSSCDSPSEGRVENRDERVEEMEDRAEERADEMEELAEEKEDTSAVIE
ncbi:hypothetical protein DXT99_16175 [Pontibacter diazotrophicus]|uniref:Uncharacterized protein n=1 Tax=Pontibacter diazotrophicus TaxID=1400979 RepID=A0A3D8L9S2_9BACT|nr:hypothetical protein [Pontibacter diazotrophicus]RDV14103.1 hypothetical protein DXT99_16175 [Pontibacter diazotrophicus]